MPGPEQRATGMPAHAHPALPVAPADPPVAMTQGAADVLLPGPPMRRPSSHRAATSPLLLAQGGSYGLAGKLASTNIVLPFLCAALGGSLIVAGLLVPLGIIGTLVGYTLGPNMLASRLPSRTVMALATLGTAALLFALATIGLLFRDKITVHRERHVPRHLPRDRPCCRGSAPSPSPTSWPARSSENVAAGCCSPRRPSEACWRAWWRSSRPGCSRVVTRSSVTSPSSGSPELPGRLGGLFAAHRGGARAHEGGGTARPRRYAARGGAGRATVPVAPRVPDPADPLPVGHARDDLLQHPGRRSARQRPGQPGRDHRHHPPGAGHRCRPVGAGPHEAGVPGDVDRGDDVQRLRRGRRGLRRTARAGGVTVRPRHLHPVGHPGQRRGQRRQVGLPRGERPAGGAVRSCRRSPS